MRGGSWLPPSTRRSGCQADLPRALVVGSFIVVLTYILYYIGLTGAVTTEELMASGEAAAKMAFQRVFGETAGTVVFVLIVISCLGTLNGLTLSCCRGMYALAVRNEGPMPELFRQVDPVTNMAGNSALVSLGLSALWLVYFYGANVGGPWFGPFSFDSSELPDHHPVRHVCAHVHSIHAEEHGPEPFPAVRHAGSGPVRLCFYGVCRLCRVWSDRAVLSGGVRRGHGHRLAV